MLTNPTPFHAHSVPYFHADGREVVIVVVKGTFVVTAEGVRLADEQLVVRIGDEIYAPDAEESSVRLPNDVVPEKVGADVVVVGAAVAPRPAPYVDVAVGVQERRAALRVHGPRIWVRGLTGQVVIGKAAPFLREPVVYEAAHGGMSDDLTLVERRNPVGRGVATRPTDLLGRPAPQIEDPRSPITSASDRPAPVGLGAISTHWLPRAGYAGTLDEAWQHERMPLMPLDFDPRFYNCAHPLLRLEERLRPGDPVRIEGMRLEGPLGFAVPEMSVQVVGRRGDGRTEALVPSIDQLVVWPEEGRFECSSRATFALGRGSRRLRELTVEEVRVGS